MENRKKDFCYDDSTIDDCLELVDKNENVSDEVKYKPVVQKKN